MQGINRYMHHYTFETILLIISSLFIFVISLFDHKIALNNATLFTILVMVITSMVKGGGVFVGGAFVRYIWSKIFKEKKNEN